MCPQITQKANIRVKKHRSVFFSKRQRIVIDSSNPLAIKNFISDLTKIYNERFKTKFVAATNEHSSLKLKLAEEYAKNQQQLEIDKDNALILLNARIKKTFEPKYELLRSAGMEAKIPEYSCTPFSFLGILYVDESANQDLYNNFDTTFHENPVYIDLENEAIVRIWERNLELGRIGHASLQIPKGTRHEEIYASFWPDTVNKQSASRSGVKGHCNPTPEMDEWAEGNHEKPVPAEIK